jgi:hypothetical protein
MKALAAAAAGGVTDRLVVDINSSQWSSKAPASGWSTTMD